MSAPKAVRAGSRAPSRHPSDERVYLAAPKSEYETTRYRRLARRAGRLFPNAVLIEARTAFSGLADWSLRWVPVLKSVARFVFITTPDGFIGRGVWAEIRDAQARVPVCLLTDEGALIPLDDLTFSPADPEDWTRHVRVT